jgi:hypothetical protein
MVVLYIKMVSHFIIFHNSRSSRLSGFARPDGGMRRWQGNGRGLLWPRRLGLAVAESAKRLSAEGASPALTSEHPESRVALP